MVRAEMGAESLAMTLKARAQALPFRVTAPNLRERVLSEGAHALGHIELLAVLLGTGAEGQPAMVIAASVLVEAGSLLGLVRSGPHGLSGHRGVGPAKAARIFAALELGRRANLELSANTPLSISGVGDVEAWARPRLAHLEHEEVWLLMLDGRNLLKATRRIAVGGMHGASLSVRDVLRPALRDGASAIVLVHNHPSGNPTPSQEDLSMTRKLAAACAVVQLPLVDHVVVAKSGASSLYEAGAIL